MLVTEHVPIDFHYMEKKKIKIQRNLMGTETVLLPTLFKIYVSKKRENHTYLDRHVSK